MSTNMLNHGTLTRRSNMRGSGLASLRWGAWVVSVCLGASIVFAPAGTVLADKPPPKKGKPVKVSPERLDRERVKLIGAKSDAEGEKGKKVVDPSGPHPVITCAERVHDFGTVWVGPTLEHTFTIKNEGNAPLHISKVRPSCGCMVAGKYPTVLAPGESGKFPFAAKSTKMRGKFEKGITIKSNDPVTPSYQVRLRGEVKRYIEIVPPSVHFGKLSGDEAVTRELNLTNNTETPLELKIKTPLKDNFEAELTETTPGKAYKLRVTGKPPFKPGVFRQKLALGSNIAEREMLNIDIRGSVPQRLEVFPTALDLRKQRGGPQDADTGMTRVVRLTNYGPTPVKLLDASVDDPAVKLEVNEQREGKAYMVRVNFPPGYAPPSKGAALTLKTDDGAQPKFTVPIRGSAATAQKPPPQQTPRKRPAEELVGKAAPKFELATVDGKKISNETLAGTVTVLDFVSNRCGHCTKQLPRVEKIRKTYQDKGVRFIAVGSGGTEEQVKDKIKQLGFQGELVVDTDRKGSSAFKVQGVPSMAILGKTGKVEAVTVGNAGDLDKRMKGQLDALLAGKPVPTFAAAAQKPPQQPAARKRPAEELVGKAAPKFELTTVDGKKISNETLADTVTVLDFVSNRCGHCTKQLPRVEKMRKTYQDKGVRFIAVGSGGTEEQVKDKIKQLGFQGELVVDTDRKGSSAFKVRGVPSMAILGKTGKVEAVTVGNVGDLDKRMKGQLDALLAGKPVPTLATAPASPPRRRPATELVGKPAPEFSITTVDGKKLSNAELASHPATVLNFVAPNCGFCKRQVPTVEKVRKEYEAKGVRFVNVVQKMRKDFTTEEIVDVFSGAGSQLEISTSDFGDNKIGRNFKATGFPTLFVVGRDGKVANVTIGAKQDLETQLRAELDALLKANP